LKRINEYLNIINTLHQSAFKIYDNPPELPLKSKCFEMSLRMRYKILLGFAVLALTGVYFFISSPIRVSAHVQMKETLTDAFALVGNENNWNQWQQKETAPGTLHYCLTKNKFPAIVLSAKSDVNNVPIEIVLQGAGKTDSTILSWHCEIPAGYMPWTRVQRYLEARRLKGDFSKALQMFVAYIGDEKNIYGIGIRETKLKDTIIATSSGVLLTPPSTSLGCRMANELRQQIITAGLSITGPSMLLTIRETENKYKIMVGFPVNKIPDPTTHFDIKKMIPGKLLTGTVYGGPAAIHRGHEQMKKYIMDKNREEVALPYEVSVTNKCAVPDTTKWITEICYPVY
jgi:hypothetical protein